MFFLLLLPCENLLLLPPKIFTTTTTNSKPHLHHHHHVKLLHFSPLLKPHFKSTLSSSTSSPLSSPAAPPSEEEEEEEDSSSSSLTTTVDFLMDSGGLSYEQALQVIREKPTLLLDGGRKPRSVIAYFGSSSIGLSKTHISKAISKCPRLLVADVEKTLKPKIQMFQDFGFSKSDIAELIALHPSILRRGLKTGIKPGLELIKSFVKTDEDLIRSIKRRGPFLLGSINHRKWIEPNMDVLRQLGVPDSEILYLISSSLMTLMSKPKRFKSIVERIASLGFKPETKMFVTAVASMSQMKKPTWDSKIDLLKGGLGWSDEQILDAFRRYPRFLTLSRQNLEESIGFFSESLNWDASVLSQDPFILNFSLKRRVIPRYAVLKCLMSKEIIIEEDRDRVVKVFIHMLKLPETKFLSKYVFKYQEQLPYLYEEVYKKECKLGCEEEKDNGEITPINKTIDDDMTSTWG